MAEYGSSPVGEMDLGTTSPGKKWSGLPGKDRPQAMAAYVDRLFGQARTLRRQDEVNWYIDIKYLGGDQWVSWDPRKSALYNRPKKPWRIRQTINHLRSSMEVLVNVITQQHARIQATPASSEPEDRQGAKAAEKLWNYLWQTNDMDEQIDELVHWMFCCSRGIMKVGWDETAGEVVSLPDYESPMTEADVLAGPGFEPPNMDIPVGEIVCSVVPTFNFFIDPAATSIEKARWCGDVGYMHISEAMERWPEAGELEADGGSEAWFNYARKLITNYSDRSSAEDFNDTVTVKEIYFRPDGKYPNGRKVVVAGGKVVEDVESPFGGNFPYVDFLCYRNPGSYWGQSAVNLGRNAQTSFNRYRSLVMEALLKHNNHQWAVAKGSGVKRTALTDEPGNVFYYNPVGVDPVKALHPPPLPGAWQQLLGLDLQDMRDQMGVVDVLRGVNPPGVRSGRSLAYLQEQTLGRHGPMVRRFERSLAKLGKLWLFMAQKFYAEDRMLPIVGDGNKVEAYRLKQSDLLSATNIIVTAGSVMPESKAARQDFVMTMFQNGMIVTEEGLPDTQKALRMMDMASKGDLYDSDEDSRGWAMEENEKMWSGEPIMPEPHDNHPLHAEVHVAFMRTSRFRDLPPERQDLFRQHLDRHIEYLNLDSMPAEEPTLAEGGGMPEEDMRGGGGGPEPRTDMRGGPE